MPKIINHEERKELIMKTALKVFGTYGYKETNLSLIAKECGLSRTTVYQYFSSIDEVLHYAVKTGTDVLFEKYNSAQWQGVSTPFELLQRITTDILDCADQYKTEITNFILIMKSFKPDLGAVIHHRSVKLKILFSRLIRKSQADGQIVSANSGDLVMKLIILIETYCLHLAFFEDQADKIRELLEAYILSLKV